ncbi:MAG TPA: hypothetical protein VEU31_09340 [Candidatus Acidoferrales bacterium]|nr:hypothetical protein [Candidatus Acidoferrales bacterium]
MLSEHVFTIFHRSITITDRDIIVAGAAAAVCFSIWAVLHLYRSNVVVLHRAGGVDHLVQELARIAEALERIANRPAERALAAAKQRAEEPHEPRSRSVSYSMLGR